MRIHVIRARTLPMALQMVRDAHGDEAIVLDTEETPDGAVVRVGLDAAAAPEPPPAPQSDLIDPPPAKPAPPQPISAATDRAAEALAWHGAPPLVIRGLLLAVEQSGEGDPELALAGALDQAFRFGRPENLHTPLALVGPPGAGKTATLAKLAAARSLNGADVAIVNADIETAGAEGRVGAFAEALGVEARRASDADDIAAAIAEAGPEAVALVDTSGRAPADADDIAEMAREIEAAGHGVLVLSAAIAPVEAAELAECFAAAGAESLVMTQLDIARRIGALLAAANAGGLAIAGVSMGRKVGDGLMPLTADTLARLILAPPTPLPKPQQRRQARAADAYARTQTAADTGAAA